MSEKQKECTLDEISEMMKPLPIKELSNKEIELMEILREYTNIIITKDTDNEKLV